MTRRGALDRLERNARRVSGILAVLVRYGLADWLRRIPGARMKGWLRDAEGQSIPQLGTPERIRLALTELGTAFIKLGQMVSTRPDLVGPELARELGKLQSGAPPDPPGAAERIVEAELGQAPSALFASFDPEPFASASIAQVHRARLRSGEEVVLKIQKEGIIERIEADLGLLADLAELAERYVAELKPYRPMAVVRQATKMLRDELDFALELQNLETFRRNFASDDGVHFPRPCPAFSSRRVLTMERLDGILVSEVEELAESGADLDGFARRGATMYLDMVFRDSFYHADPHPGNLMLLPGAVVGVLDCGMVQRLDEGLRDEIEGIFLAVAQSDTDALADAVWDLGTTPPLGSREQLRTELSEFLGQYAGLALNRLDLSAALTTFTDIVHRNHVLLPPGVSLLLRTLIELEGTGKLLNPSFSLAEIIQPYYVKAMRRRLSPRRLAGRMQRGVRDWDRLLQTLPRDLNEALQRMRAGTLTMHLDHRRLDPVVNRLVMGLLTSSLFVGSSLLWSMEAPPLVRGVSLFGALGYLLSLYLGVRLFRPDQALRVGGGRRPAMRRGLPVRSLLQGNPPAEPDALLLRGRTGPPIVET